MNIKYEIGIYDNDNDLMHNYFVVETDDEKDKVLKEFYHGDKEAKYCTVERIETYSQTLIKENFGVD